VESLADFCQGFLSTNGESFWQVFAGVFWYRIRGIFGRFLPIYYGSIKAVH